MSHLMLKPAPGFRATAIMPDGSVAEGYSLENAQGSYRLLFFYPFDFSIVCPTELLALDQAVEDFEARDCQVIGISVDSHFSHKAWRDTPVEDGGIGPVRYPLVADLTKSISREYGILLDEAVALRGTFLLDRNGTVRHASVNDLDVGRSVPEILRTLDAVRRFDDTGETCPANWDGSKSAGPAPAGIKKRVQSFEL